MTHDPMCAISSTRCGGRDMKHHSLWSEPPAECEKCGAECDCDLIAKVRADERGKYASEWLGANNLHSKEITE